MNGSVILDTFLGHVPPASQRAATRWTLTLQDVKLNLFALAQARLVLVGIVFDDSTRMYKHVLVIEVAEKSLWSAAGPRSGQLEAVRVLTNE